MPIDYDKLPKSIQAQADRIAGKKPRQKRIPKAVDQYSGIQTDVSQLIRRECPIHKHVWYSKEEVPCWECSFEKEEAGTVNPGSQLGENGN